MWNNKSWCLSGGRENALMHWPAVLEGRGTWLEQHGKQGNICQWPLSSQTYKNPALSYFLLVAPADSLESFLWDRWIAWRDQIGQFCGRNTLPAVCKVALWAVCSVLLCPSPEEWWREGGLSSSLRHSQTSFERVIFPNEWPAYKLFR